MDKIVYDDINEFNNSSVLIKSILNEQVVYIYNIDKNVNREILYLMGDILKTNYEALIYFDPPNGFFYTMPILNSCLLYSKMPNSLYIFIHLFRFSDDEKGFQLLVRLLEYKGIAIMVTSLHKSYEEKTINLCKQMGFVEGVQNSNEYLNLEYHG